MSDQPLWIIEHDDDYEVPAEVTQIEGILDISWHNDTCPRFGVRPDGIGPNLWVEHPDPDRRELGGPRFMVSVQFDDVASHLDTDLYAGDDVNAAVAASPHEALYRPTPTATTPGDCAR